MLYRFSAVSFPLLHQWKMWQIKERCLHFTNSHPSLVLQSYVCIWINIDSDALSQQLCSLSFCLILKLSLILKPLFGVCLEVWYTSALQTSLSQTQTLLIISLLTSESHHKTSRVSYFQLWVTPFTLYIPQMTS